MAIRPCGNALCSAMEWPIYANILFWFSDASEAETDHVRHPIALGATWALTLLVPRPTDNVPGRLDTAGGRPHGSALRTSCLGMCWG
jgi:hypothetical protein